MRGAGFHSPCEEGPDEPASAGGGRPLAARRGRRVWRRRDAAAALRSPAMSTSTILGAARFRSYASGFCTHSCITPTMNAVMHRAASCVSVSPRELAPVDGLLQQSFDVDEATAVRRVLTLGDRGELGANSHLWKMTSNTACVRGSVASRVSPSIGSVRSAASGSSCRVSPAVGEHRLHRHLSAFTERIEEIGLVVKCQYTAPRVTPADAATSSSDVWATPWSRNTRSAASSSASRVAAASVLVRLAIFGSW